MVKNLSHFKHQMLTWMEILCNTNLLTESAQLSVFFNVEIVKLNVQTIVLFIYKVFVIRIFHL